MSQYQRVINLDRREYLEPNDFAPSDRQLISLNDTDSTMYALALLTAASNTGDTGDFKPCDENHETIEDELEHPLIQHLVGRWAGDRIAIVGDGWKPGKRGCAPLDLDDDAWNQMSRQTDGWTNISEHVIALIELDRSIKERRHEVQLAPSGAAWTQADGFNVNSKYPKAPRSLFNEETGEITAIPELPPVDPTTLPIEAEPLEGKLMVDLHRDLLDCRTMLGSLDDELEERIVLAATHPNQKTWSGAYSIIVGGPRAGTLWTNVTAVDPTFPGSAANNEFHEPQWERVPDGGTILAAVRNAAEYNRGQV